MLRDWGKALRAMFVLVLASAVAALVVVLTMLGSLALFSAAVAYGWMAARTGLSPEFPLYLPTPTPTAQVQAHDRQVVEAEIERSRGSRAKLCPCTFPQNTLPDGRTDNTCRRCFLPVFPVHAR